MITWIKLFFALIVAIIAFIIVIILFFNPQWSLPFCTNEGFLNKVIFLILLGFCSVIIFLLTVEQEKTK